MSWKCKICNADFLQSNKDQLDYAAVLEHWRRRHLTSLADYLLELR